MSCIVPKQTFNISLLLYMTQRAEHCNTEFVRSGIIYGLSQPNHEETGYRWEGILCLKEKKNWINNEAK